MGNYRVEAKIGEGGMGAVYLATHPLLGRKAAIKILLPEHSKRPDLVTRFFNEAKTAASLRHPALVEVFDFGFLPDGAGYLVMDFLEGQSLNDRLTKVKRLSAEAAAEVGRQIAAGVAAAHGQGIVHRDLKPDNIFLVPDPENPGRERVKILDFGIAKLLLPSPSASQGARDVRTSTGMLLGTPLFMAPEQCRGAGQIDHRADIYSVGCILYMMVTGRPPFDHAGVGEVLAAHLHEAVTPPRTLVPDLPPMIEAITMRALAKKPEERFQNMAELGAELQRFLNPAVPSLATRVAPAPAPAGKRRGPLILVTALVAAGVAGMFWWKRPRPAPTGTVATATGPTAPTPGPAATTAPPPAPPTASKAPPTASKAPPASDPVAQPPATGETAPPPGQQAAGNEAPPPAETVVETDPKQGEGIPPAGEEVGAEAKPPGPTTAERGEPEVAPPRRRGGKARGPAPRTVNTAGGGSAFYRQAMNHRAQGEEDQALLAFRSALSAGGLDPDEKADAERQSIALRRKFGEVEVLCNIADAQVTIDGRLVGKTPLGRPVLVTPGRHTLVISREGYRTITRTFDLAGNGRLLLRFTADR